jgi:hypothetical protein
MKRYQLLGLALVAVFAFSAIVASAAGAVEFLLAEFLEAGAKITTAKASDSEGELELKSLNGGGFGVESIALCSGIFDGTTGPGSTDELTKLLNLAGTEIGSTPLSGTALTCTNDKNCTEPKAYAVGLPYKTELELMVDGSETFFVDLLTSASKKVGYYVECLVLGASIAEECTVETSAVKQTNESNGTVDGEFSDAFQVLAGLKLATCTLGGSEEGEVNGLGFTLLTSGTALTVSSE